MFVTPEFVQRNTNAAVSVQFATISLRSVFCSPVKFPVRQDRRRFENPGSLSPIENLKSKIENPLCSLLPPIKHSIVWPETCFSQICWVSLPIVGLLF